MENTFSTFENKDEGGGGGGGIGAAIGGVGEAVNGMFNGGGDEMKPFTPLEGNEIDDGNMLPIPSMTTNNDTGMGFTDSNSMVGQLSFIMLIFFLFIIFMKFGVDYITSLSNPSKMVIINGMVDGQHTINISQDPTIAGSVSLPRSNNMTEGIEFTYSVWIFLESSSSTSAATANKQYQHIFSKGSEYMFQDTNVVVSTLNAVGSSVAAQNNLTNLIPPNNYVVNAPGVYLYNNNNLLVIMNTFNTIYENIQVTDLPMNKWFNLMIRCEGKTFDVFINGNIVQSIMLSGVPKQNYGDINIAMNNGFPGYLSNLTYYTYALGTKAIGDIVTFGPNTTASQYNLVKDSYNSFFNTNYLSANWYFNEMGNK